MTSWWWLLFFLLLELHCEKKKTLLRSGKCWYSYTFIRNVHWVKKWRDVGKKFEGKFIYVLNFIGWEKVAAIISLSFYFWVCSEGMRKTWIERKENEEKWWKRDDYLFYFQRVHEMMCSQISLMLSACFSSSVPVSVCLLSLTLLMLRNILNIIERDMEFSLE